MNCLDWEERVALFAGGDLAEGVEQHLAECAGCREFCAELVATMDSLRDEHRSEIDAAHFTAVRSRVMAEIERGRRVWRRLAWASGVGIAAALMLGVVMRPGPLPSPPARVALTIPGAELVRSAGEIRQPAGSTRSRASGRRGRLPHREPVVVKLQTKDPNIVIYWIAD